MFLCYKPFTGMIIKGLSLFSGSRATGHVTQSVSITSRKVVGRIMETLLAMTEQSADFHVTWLCLEPQAGEIIY